MTRVDAMEMDSGYRPIYKHVEIAKEFWDRNDPEKRCRIPLNRLKERLLLTEEADGLPNALVLRLLKEADEDEDGFLGYEEFLQFAETSAKYSKAREALSRAALSVVPRGERTVQRRTYLQECRCCPPALFMVTATLVEVGAFVYYAVDMDRPVGPAGPAPVYSPLIYNPFRRYEAWRYVSYALIHSGYVHLVANLTMQLALGLLLELANGWRRVGAIYVGGVLAGSLSQSVAAPRTYLAGASGGVYALTYAHVGNLLLNWSEMSFRWVQLSLCLALTIADVSFALWDSYGSPTPSNTGHMAHLGGAVAGILVGISILRNLERKRWERYCWWAALLLYFGLLLTAVVLNAALPVPEFFPDSDYTDLEALRRTRLESHP